MFRFNHHNQGAYYLSFAKVKAIKNNQLKYIVVVSSVVWLHILLGPYWCVCVCMWCTVRNETQCDHNLIVGLHPCMYLCVYIYIYIYIIAYFTFLFALFSQN